MFNRKGIVSLVLLCFLLLTTVSAFALEFPAYGCITGNKVNVRKFPDEMYPSLGQLVNKAPVVITGEKDSAYLCSTYFGEGYIPKQYVTVFEGMTSAEFAEYKDEHASIYRKKAYPCWKDTDNYHLLMQYYAGEISEKQLLDSWHREPCTGYTGLRRNDDGKLYPFRGWWW